MITIKKGYATKVQIAQAIQEQKRQAAQGNSIHLGESMVLLNLMTGSQRDEILEIQKNLKGQPAVIKSATEKIKKPSEPETTEPPAETDESGAEKEPVPEEPDEEENPPDFEGAKCVQNGSGYELVILKDRFRAYLRPQEEKSGVTSIEQIKDLINIEEISANITDDSKIIEYLNSNPEKDHIFRLAFGTPVDPGKAPEIKYHFNTDPLKPGTVDESGKINYKDRGKIPWVNAEDLIAEITPGTEGKPGKDVYGKVVDPPPPDIINLKCGTGIKKGDQESMAFAEIDGRPELLEDGTICVSDTLTIPGDVGVETGNIEFEGHLVVKGAIQEGYKVKGKSIKALEIHNAEIAATEDIVVEKGIIGSKVETDGDVKARHIRDTEVDALGDVNIEKEVYESHIECNGTFRIERGTIMGSTISAMKGLEAQELGSDASDPCTIITGIDNRLEKQITHLNMKIADREKQIEKLRTALEEILDKPGEIEDEINELAQKQDQLMRKGLSVKQTLKTFQQTNDQNNLKKVLTIAKALNIKLEQMQKEIDELSKKQEQYEEKISKSNEYITRIEKEIEEFHEDISSMLEMSKIRQPSEGVRVTGTVYDRTSIRGRNASMIVNGKLQRVIFQEIKNPDEKSDQSWLMSTSTI